MANVRGKKGRPGNRPTRGGQIDVDRRDKKILVESSLALLRRGSHRFEIPTNRKEWYDWTYRYMPIPIPRHRVCKDHDTPLDFFIQYVTGTLDHFLNIIFCSRESFKTYLLAMGSAVKAMLWPGCEILSMGAIKEQAKQGYGYWAKFWRGFVYAPDYLNIRTDLQSVSTYFLNGSTFDIGAFTEAMANSKRAQIVNVDEVDSVEPSLRDVLTDDLLNVPSEMNGVKPSITFTSSVRRAAGTMSWMLEKDGKIEQWLQQGICKLWHWCYKECTERCTRMVEGCDQYFERQKRHGELKALGEFRTKEEQKEYRSLIGLLGAAEKKCSIVVTCHGDLRRAAKPIKPDALRKIGGVGGLLDKVRGLSQEAIEAQLDCRLPRQKGLLFDPELLTDVINPDLFFRNETWLENYLLIDWGYSDATVALLVQEDQRIPDRPVDYLVARWRWVKKDPNWRVEQLQTIHFVYNVDHVHADSENADMNKLLEDAGVVELKRVAFGAPSGTRMGSKLSYAVGICERRLEHKLLQIAEECNPVKKCLGKLLNKPRAGNRFGVKDDHDASALFTKYAEERERNYGPGPTITRGKTETVVDVRKEDKPVLITTSDEPTFKFPGEGDLLKPES